MKHISLQPQSAETCRKLYVREHAKFIHSSYTIAEDLGKTVKINEFDYTIVGIWDIVGHKKNILLKEVGKETSYAYADSKIVAEALGFTNYRNLVTGVQVPYDMAAEFRIKKANKFKLEALEALEDIEPVVIDEFESIDDEVDEDEVIIDEDNAIIDDDSFEDDLEENPEDEDEDIDPLVKALRQADDNEDYYNDNDTQ
jgi:hypothetical protein